MPRMKPITWCDKCEEDIHADEQFFIFEDRHLCAKHFNERIDEIIEEAERLAEDYKFERM